MVLAAVRRQVGAVGEAVQAVRVLVRRGVIDPKRLDRVVSLAVESGKYGPQAALVRSGARQYGDAPSFADERGELSFREIDEQSNSLARGLAELGVHDKSVIGLLARDHRGLVLGIAAGGKLGARVVLLNTGFGKTQFAEVVEREHVDVLLHDEEFAALANAIGSSVPKVLTWVEDEGRPSSAAPTIESIGQKHPGTALPAPKQLGGFVILTSGTTGLPKGAPRGKASPLATVQLVDRIPFPRKDSVVIVSPLFHSTGMITWLVSAGLGNKVVVRRRFDPEATLRLVAEHRASMLVAVPTMLHRIVELPAEVRAGCDTSSLQAIVIAGSALSPELAVRTRDVFGDVLYNMYGSTEVAIATVGTPADQAIAPGTAGRPPVTCSVALFDDDDRRVYGNNKTGRIFVHNGAPFEGYTDGRDKQVIEGFMSSGDVGHFDDNGLLFVDGRDDDMIVSGGENVFPLEVENLLVRRPDVFDAAVIGVDDADFGKRLRAFIVPELGSKPDPDDIRAFVKENLARYKVPRDVVFLDELPRNATGKLLRRVLVEMDVPM
ncbi:acyl-CoA synthetase [Aldersonia sp. NBC_00410]|uniref:acyl-CoA synthetase n=1 Tax=Aldersonia sp. NBC_00410 TaxID=2975954 RepID=UPI00224EDAAD|nr:acyl-CoA synthetase [Aldersonia sp. NBC_00410]MCX5044627.1 acyl-CoA synthetase [Aldersonia sp. NBC_00410]